MNEHAPTEPQRSADRWVTPVPLSPDNPITDLSAVADADAPRRMTVGELRAALAQYPDDTPLRFAVPDPEFPDDFVDEAFAATGADFGEAQYSDERGTVQDTFLTVNLEPTGIDPRDELMNYAQPSRTPLPRR